MIFEPDDRLKQKMSKNGSVLQYMYSVSGAGKGLFAMGVMLMGIGILLGAVLVNTMGTHGAIRLGGAMVIPGILIAVLGISMQRKKEQGWAEAYRKACGLSEQELHQIDLEFRQPGTILLSMDQEKDTNSLKRMGFITANYVKLPSMDPFVFRLKDLAACLYTKKYLCQDGGYDSALVAYIADGELGFIQRNPPEKASLAIVKAIAEHNPGIITDHFFTYEGKEYDAVRNPEEVIRLHRQLYGKDGSEAGGGTKACPTPVSERAGYQTAQRREPKKTGWEPYGWKRGVALVILFFILMGIMYGPKIYRRYQMDHGGIVTEEGAAGK